MDDGKRAFNDLELVFPHAVRALENGLMEAKEYFDSKSMRIDSAVFSAIVRLHARDYLRVHQLDAGEKDFIVEQVNLCGLWLKVGRYHLKIWKISAVDLAKALGRQSSGEQLSLVDDRGIPIVMDLALYWTMDESHHLGEMYLVLPRYDDPRCLEWIWARSVNQLVTESVERIMAGNIRIEEISVERIDQR